MRLALTTVSRMSPQAKVSMAMMTRAAASITVGIRGTRPVAAYSAMTGIPAMRPSTRKMRVTQEKNESGL